MVMIEALACGTPVVAYRYATAPEIVDHGVTGFLCDDLDDLATKLVRGQAPRSGPLPCRSGRPVHHRAHGPRARHAVRSACCAPGG
jgi:hypothetical protein